MEVLGIKVDQRTPAIHFLGATHWQAPAGTEVARLVIHCADGTQIPPVPLRGVEHLSNWCPGSREPLEATRVGWRGSNSAGCEIVLSEIVWENPNPEKTISTIDFVSAESSAAPFLVGITLE